MNTSPPTDGIAPKTGTCGHPALFTWHYAGYTRESRCLYCELEKRLAPEPRDDEAAGQVEHLDRANHRLTRCLQAVMADLVDLLDADQFNNIEARVLSAGVPYPPLGTDPRLSTTPAAKYVEGGKCPTCGHCGNCDGHGIVSGTNANSEVFSDCPVCRPLTKPASRDRTPATARCECRTCCNTFMGAPGDFNCATCLPGNGGEK